MITAKKKREKREMIEDMPAAAAALPSPSLPVEMRGRFRKFGINAHSRTMYDEALNIQCPASLAIRTMKIL